MENTVKIVGTGPGDGRYVTPIALEIISEAEVLVGGKRQLAQLAGPHQEQFAIGSDLPAVLEFIESRRGQQKVVVLASGDPGLYSIAAYLAANMDQQQLEMIPGISSVQLMFARLKRPWQGVQILSLHGREGEEFERRFAQPGVTALLTGGEWTPQEIASHLLKSGLPDCPAAIGKDLSYPGERVIRARLSELAEHPEDLSNCVMVVFHE
ncbi:MAG: precorrin-6y C5,15-methyltransferase (decarboxylating) subunit CbiE [Syntrophomonadaceae bacterium]|nr:precorrin-6y C5,15-methyltransferase (decarboxylating) subunit CbiE [Syntrophomonadaceae bacterium]